jgi:hypothetical protein
MVEEIDNIIVEEGNDQLAIEITAGRKCSNTKNQYRLKVQHFRKWVEINHSTFLNGDSTLNLTSIDKIVLREFFGHICKKKENSGAYLEPVVFHAFQHVGLLFEHKC